MLLTRLLNACHHFPGFVYEAAHLRQASQTIEIEVRPRRGSRPCCSGCGRRGSGYDQLPVRRFEFIPVWGFAVVLLYAMRRVDCRHGCGVKVEQVPWGIGKHTLTKAYMQFLAQWARRLSWQETARSFRTSWEKVYQAVEWVVEWGLERRSLDSVRAIGVDEIQYGRGHQYLTLVYQIEAGMIRLLWVGKDRTLESFQKFFTLIGSELARKIEFVCSDMWKPYLDLIAQHCTNALNILDRFHVVAKMNKAIDEVRASEAKRMAYDGYAPPEANPLVPAQASRESHRHPATAPARPAALQPQERPCLPAQGGLPAVLGVRLTDLGRQVPRPVVHPGHALTHRADEEICPHHARPPRAPAQLLPCPKAVLQRRHRGAQQQSQSHHEKSLWLPDLPSDRSRALSCTWQATRAAAHP